MGQFGQDFGLGVGQGENQGLRRHRGQPFGLEYAWSRQAEKDIRAWQGVGQRARLSGLGVAGHVGRHGVAAVGADHALDVGQRHVLDRQAHGDQEIDASQGRGAGTRGDEAGRFERLALDHQAVADSGRADDGGAVLVVVEDRDRHAFAQPVLDLETFGSLDVLEVDGPEGRLQRRHDLDEPVGILGIHLDVEDIDAGEFLEQDRLALHDGLSGQRTDVAEAEDGRSIGDHADEIAAGREVARRVRILDDRLAGGRDARRIGQREIALRRHALGRLDRELSGPRVAVIVERRLDEVLVHLLLPCFPERSAL